ncbi:MAG TPA: hypothetical protein VMR14_03500 [Streptosporangiaceae bacterium]|jgi:hypothetical protein|nr:hypothetical protein [Streptosporangiaceae bacterium]
MAIAVPMARSRGSLSGLALVLLGGWGGLAPLIGPYFNFGFAPDQAWHYSTGRLYLSLVPGGVVLLTGLVVLFTKSRGFGGFCALLAALGGAWFIVGQAVLQIITGTSYSDGAPVATTTSRILLGDLACFAGVGTLIVFFAALALGRQSIAAHKDHLKFGDAAVIAGAVGAVGAGGLASVGLTPPAPGYDSYQPTSYEPTAYQPPSYDPPAGQGTIGGGESYPTTTNQQPVVGGGAQFPNQYPAGHDPFANDQQFPPGGAGSPDPFDQYGASTNTYSPGGAITYSPGQTQYPPTQEQTNSLTAPTAEQQFPPQQR